ncbi:3740_t:CDS:2, partial [Dentiscutata heterogama]
MIEFTLIHANDQTDDCKNITSTELTSMEVTHIQTNKLEDVNDSEMEIKYLNMLCKRNFIEKDSDSSLVENEQDAGKRQLNETETGGDQNSDKKPRYTNTYRKLNKHNCKNMENKPSSSTSFRSIVQPKRRLFVINMNRKAESSNTYNTGKSKLAEHKIPELQKFDTNNTVPVSQPPIYINT